MKAMKEHVRTSIGTEQIKGAPANDNAAPEGTRLRLGAPVEVWSEVERMWWAGEVTGIKRTRGGGVFVRIRMHDGAPFGTTVVTSDSMGKAWRVSALAVHHVPLTGQGVRNLNMAAPAKFRNGRRARDLYGEPGYMAVCEHPHEALMRVYGDTFDDEGEIRVIEEPVYRGDPWFPQEREFAPARDEKPLAIERFVCCGQCGAEVFDGAVSWAEWSRTAPLPLLLKFANVNGYDDRDRPHFARA